MAVYVLLGGIVGLLAVGVPIGIVLVGMSLVYLLMTGIPPDAALGRMVGSLNSFTIMAVPFFIIAGQVMNEAKLTQRLVEFTRLLVGHFRAGLAQVNVAASMLFAGMSGSALADAGGLGTVLIPAMEEDGYDTSFAAAVTAASCTIGPLIPPSIAMVLYGVIAEVSIGRLFLGGAIPGVVLGLAFMTTLRLMRKLKGVRRHPRASARQVARGSGTGIIALAMPVIILVGITAGIFTPTEAAVVAAVYAIAIGLLVVRTLSIRSVVSSARDGMLVSGSVLFIASGTAVFGWILAREGMVTTLLDGLTDTSLSPMVMLLVLNLILLVAGMFIEPVSGILLLTPIMAPLIGPLGIDPVHFGVIFVMNLNFGLVTPPMGLALYVVSDVSGASFSSIVREMVPFYVPMGATLLAVTIWPPLTLWLPQMFL